MKEELFINEALDEAIKLYIASSFNQDGLTYNSFLVVVIRTLVLIYGEDRILNPYYLKDEEAFYHNLTIYGYNLTDVLLFRDALLNFYQEEKLNKKNKYQKPITYFQTVIEYLIDMFILKKGNTNVNYLEEEQFLNLIYINNVDPYRYSYKYLMDKNNFIEKYYYTKLNNFDVTKTINIALEDLEIAPIPKEKVNLLEEINMLFKTKLTSGNGYVDILLLMSVIVTSFSVISILVLCI